MVSYKEKSSKVHSEWTQCAKLPNFQKVIILLFLAESGAGEGQENCKYI